MQGLRKINQALSEEKGTWEISYKIQEGFYSGTVTLRAILADGYTATYTTLKKQMA